MIWRAVKSFPIPFENCYRKLTIAFFTDWKRHQQSRVEQR